MAMPPVNPFRFKPRRFVDRTVWVTGACREFLDSLPPVP
jgi:hypothetical protein